MLSVTACHNLSLFLHLVLYWHHMHRNIKDFHNCMGTDPGSDDSAITSCLLRVLFRIVLSLVRNESWTRSNIEFEHAQHSIKKHNTNKNGSNILRLTFWIIVLASICSNKHACYLETMATSRDCHHWELTSPPSSLLPHLSFLLRFFQLLVRVQLLARVPKHTASEIGNCY